jgi:hypothetical protein
MYPQDYNYNQQGATGSKVAKTMNAVIVTGQYFSKKHNKQKKSYITIGKLFIYANGGMSLKLEALPINGEVINFYEIKPKSQPNQQGYNQNPPPNQNNNQYQQWRI